jgi:hypothetical protein
MLSAREKHKLHRTSKNFLLQTRNVLIKITPTKNNGETEAILRKLSGGPTLSVPAETVHGRCQSMSKDLTSVPSPPIPAGAATRAYQRFGLQNKFKFILSPEMASKLLSGADFGCNRHCKTNAVDLDGSRGHVLVVLGGFWKVLGEGGRGTSI